jgi:hypothetical protein
MLSQRATQTQTQLMPVLSLAAAAKMSQFQHDFRNRVMALKLSLYMLERQADPAMAELIHTIKALLVELGHMVDDVTG